MNNYRVKLDPKGHQGREDQIIKCATGQIYLKDIVEDIPAVYTRGEAIKKAKMFGGTIQEYSSKYQLQDVITVAHICGDVVPKELVDAVESQEPSYLDKVETLGEELFSVEVLDAVIQEAHDNDDKKVLAEAMELRQHVREHCYFIFTKI